jgi:hypothetical protein
MFALRHLAGHSSRYADANDSSLPKTTERSATCSRTISSETASAFSVSLMGMPHCGGHAERGSAPVRRRPAGRRRLRRRPDAAARGANGADRRAHGALRRDRSGLRLRARRRQLDRQAEVRLQNAAQPTLRISQIGNPLFVLSCLYGVRSGSEIHCHDGF